MKTVKRVLLFFVIFFVSFLLVLILGVAVTPEDQENMPVWVGIALVVVPISLGILIVNKAVPVSAEEKVKRETVNCNLQLVGGLDLAAGSICSAVCSPESISFSASGQTFTLSPEKLIDVSVMTPQEIQTQYVSSVGGAIAGGIFLGPIGAALGGSAQKKKTKIVRQYLIFAYQTDSEVKYIVFDVTSAPQNGKKISKIYAYLKKNENKQVSL
jgi:hypothetical protein|nr:MAG TPA: hypothetical protein [Caudoviricetes sp.]